MKNFINSEGKPLNNNYLGLGYVACLTIKDWHDYREVPPLLFFRLKEKFKDT